MANRTLQNSSLRWGIAIIFVAVSLTLPDVFTDTVLADQSGTSTLTINTQEQNGTAITGIFIALEDPVNSTVLAWGYSPASFTLQNGVSYVVVPSDCNNIAFDNWPDTGSHVRERTVSITNNTLMTAIYKDNSAGKAGPSIITVNSTDNIGNSLSGLYTILQQNDTTLADGYTAKNFSANNAQKYQTAVADYGNYTFYHWSDNVTNRMHYVTTGNNTTTGLSAVYRIVQPSQTSLTHTGLVVQDPLNNVTQTQSQLETNQKYWIYGGDAPAENATFDFFEDALGLHMGVKAPANGTWAGIYATTPNTNATLFHAVITTPVATIPYQFYENGLYVQTSQSFINYVTCVSVTGSSGTTWAVVSTTGNANESTQFNVLWADTSPNQPLTRDCTIITNGNNYLKVYLDHTMVYTSNTLHLQMPEPFNAYLEPQSSYPGQLLNGTFLDYYVTTGENVRVTNLPANADTAYLVNSSGDALAAAQVENNTAYLDVGAYHFPLAASIKVYDSNYTLIATSPLIPNLYGGNEYSMH